MFELSQAVLLTATEATVLKVALVLTALSVLLWWRYERARGALALLGLCALSSVVFGACMFLAGREILALGVPERFAGRGLQFIGVGLACLGLGYAAASGTRRQALVRLGVVLLPWLILIGAAVGYALAYLYPTAFLVPVALSLGAFLRHRVRPHGAWWRVAAVAPVWVSLLAVGGYVALPNWLDYLQGHGRTTFDAPPLAFAAASPQDLQSLHGKTVVLDLWTTTCGVCFEAFPDLERLANAYADDPDVVVYAVGVPFTGDGPFSRRVAERELSRYGFAKLASRDSFDVLAERFGFQGVPTTLVVDRHGVVRYRGGLTAPPLASDASDVVRELEAER